METARTLRDERFLFLKPVLHEVLSLILRLIWRQGSGCSDYLAEQIDSIRCAIEERFALIRRKFHDGCGCVHGKGFMESTTCPYFQTVLGIDVSTQQDRQADFAIVQGITPFLMTFRATFATLGAE